MEEVELELFFGPYDGEKISMGGFKEYPRVIWVGKVSEHIWGWDVHRSGLRHHAYKLGPNGLRYNYAPELANVKEIER